MWRACVGVVLVAVGLVATLPASADNGPSSMSIVVGQPCNQLGITGMTTDQRNIATCLYSDGGPNQAHLEWKIPGQDGVTLYETFQAGCVPADARDNIQNCIAGHTLDPSGIGGQLPDANFEVICTPRQNSGRSGTVDVTDVVQYGPHNYAIRYIVSTIQTNNDTTNAPVTVQCIYHHP